MISGTPCVICRQALFCRTYTRIVTWVLSSLVIIHRTDELEMGLKEAWCIPLRDELLVIQICDIDWENVVYDFSGVNFLRCTPLPEHGDLCAHRLQGQDVRP